MVEAANAAAVVDSARTAKTVDLQVIEPARKKKINASGSLEDVNTTVVDGFRLWVRF